MTIKNVGTFTFLIFLWMMGASTSPITKPICKCLRINPDTGASESCCPPHPPVAVPPTVICNCVRKNPKTGELESCCPQHPPVVQPPRVICNCVRINPKTGELESCCPPKTPPTT